MTDLAEPTLTSPALDTLDPAPVLAELELEGASPPPRTPIVTAMGDNGDDDDDGDNGDDDDDGDDGADLGNDHAIYLPPVGHQCHLTLIDRTILANRRIHAHHITQDATTVVTQRHIRRNTDGTRLAVTEEIPATAIVAWTSATAFLDAGRPQD